MNGVTAHRNFVSNSKESIRMFGPDWMEALSKVHWSVPLVVFVPAMLALLGWSLLQQQLQPSTVAAWFLGGAAVWSLAEYLLHRFVFHYQPRSGWGQKLHFIFHGVHHDYPSDAKRLVMPPSASIPIACGFYALFRWLLPEQGAHPFTAGFMLGYLVYDMTHYAVHHATFQQPWLKALKRQHMQHHFVDPTRGFGVSSPLWDHVFGTPRVRGAQGRR